jgi:hypothetical protein
MAALVGHGEAARGKALGRRKAAPPVGHRLYAKSITAVAAPTFRQAVRG